MAVDTVPDAFRTVANVTADIAVTAISGRWGVEDDLAAQLGQQGAGGAVVGGVEPLAEAREHQA